MILGEAAEFVGGVADVDEQELRDAMTESVALSERSDGRRMGLDQAADPTRQAGW